MKKIILLLPALFLFACANETAEQKKVSAADTTIVVQTEVKVEKTADEIINGATADTAGAEIIGRWKDVTPNANRAIVLYKIGKQEMVRWVYPDGKYIDEKINNKAEEFIVADVKYDEWYVIYDDGTLGTFNNNGKISDSAKL
ncbi:MAG: hypothetical protein ACOVLD_02295 [Bacteroidia bacterium]|jgi:hypothetical protein